MAKYSPHSARMLDVFALWKELPERHLRVAKTMFYLRLRFIDCWRADVEDVWFSDKVFVLRSQKNGTINELVPIPDALIPVLKEAVNNREKGALFLGRNGKRIQRMAWFLAVYNARKRANLFHTQYGQSIEGKKLYRLTGHTMKAVFVQQGEMAGLSLRELQALGHWKNMQSVFHYLGNPLDNFDLKLRAQDKLLKHLHGQLKIIQKT